MTAARSFAGATTHWMVYGVFRDAAAQGANTAMAGPPGFPENHVFVLGVPHLANRSQAILIYPPDFARRQTQLRIAFITGHQCGKTARRSHHLRPFSWD